MILLISFTEDIFDGEAGFSTESGAAWYFLFFGLFLLEKLKIRPALVRCRFGTARGERWRRQ